MKGSLHTDELLHEVMKKEGGLRTERRLSHCFLMAVPTYARPIIVTDAAINILPTLEEKADIVQNAIELAHAVGVAQPKVAILSAVETVTPKIPSTIDAAALCKMADRGQIKGGLVDGPLAFDNAIDEEAAKTKGIVSPVAGKADILVAPEPRGRQHAGEAADVHGQRRGRRHRHRRARADHPDQPRRQRAHAPRLGRPRRAVRGRAAAGSGAAEGGGVSTMEPGLLVINAGSSSIKFAGYADRGKNEPAFLGKGQVEGLRTEPRFVCQERGRRGAGRAPVAGAITPRRGDRPHHRLDRSARHKRPGGGSGTSGRVRRGGATLARPGWTNEPSPRSKSWSPFFPLHLPHNLAAIKALAELHPALPQVACFDNSFHSTQPRVAQLFALPRRLFEQGVRRYGFHGLSYEFIARTLPEYAPEATRVVVAHLGSGASLCALRDGKSVESTLGFSGLDGLPMGTRPGALDPGVMLYLLQALGMDAKAIEKLLYTESGLLGVSGISNDMRDLLASDDPRAKEAIELFVYHITKQPGRADCGARRHRRPGVHRRHR